MNNSKIGYHLAAKKKYRKDSLSYLQLTDRINQIYLENNQLITCLLDNNYIYL
jgi:hypothetical protein